MHRSALQKLSRSRSLKGTPDDASDKKKNSIAPSRMIEHKHRTRAHMKRHDKIIIGIPIRHRLVLLALVVLSDYVHRLLGAYARVPRAP